MNLNHSSIEGFNLECTLVELHIMENTTWIEMIDSVKPLIDYYCSLKVSDPDLFEKTPGPVAEYQLRS